MSSATTTTATAAPTTNQLLDVLIKKTQYLEKALLNSRVRKSIDYVHNYRPEIRSPFEPGDLIMIEPSDKFGVYEISRDDIPTVVPVQKIHLTTDFTQSLGPLSASPGTLETQMTAFDLNLDEIGIYKIMPEDYGYRIEFKQPAQSTRFTNKVGSWTMIGADMVETFENHYQALIPELMVFADKTPITIKAYSTDPNTPNNYWVRVRVYGFQYHVNRLDNVTMQNNDPRIVASIWVGSPIK